MDLSWSGVLVPHTGEGAGVLEQELQRQHAEDVELAGRIAESGGALSSSHFPVSSAGRSTQNEDTFGWTSAEPDTQQ